MKNLKLLLILLLGSLLCTAQNMNATFQGEIEGVSPLLIHIKAKDGVVNGFFKNPSDSVISFLKGTLHADGSISLTDTKKHYPSFSGRLQGRIIEGRFTRKKKAKSHPFYAVNPRGEYSNNCGNSSYITVTLSEKGYVLKDGLRNGTEYLINIHKDNKGIYLQSDTLNAKLYSKGEALLVDTLNGLPSFLMRCGSDEDAFTFTVMESEFIGSSSFIEFPEKDQYEDLNREIIINDSLSFTLKRIPRSEYIVTKWMYPRKTYKVITDPQKAQKMLKGKLKFVEPTNNEDEEYSPGKLEITFNDKTKKNTRIWR